MKVLIVETRHTVYRFIDHGTRKICIGDRVSFSRIKDKIVRVKEIPVLLRERINTVQGHVTFYFTPEFVATANDIYDLRRGLYRDALAQVHGLVGSALVYCRWRELVRRRKR